MQVPVSGQPQSENQDARPSDLTAWTNDLFADASFDWIGWDSQA